VLFDLDGTLVDTAPDLATALNQLLAEQDKAPMAYQDIRQYVSRGAVGILSLVWKREKDEDQFEMLRQRFLEIYADCNGQQSVLFHGFAEILDRLNANDIPWGIVTNKPGWLAEPLIKHLDLDQRIGCLVSGDTLEHHKPHPAPLLHAARLLNENPQDCIYVGDARRDMEAAESANMTGVAAAYGYITGDSNPGDWPAAAIIEKPAELIALIGLK